MSKQAIGWCCALVTLVGLGAFEQLGAQEDKPGVVVAQQSAESAEQRINAVLEQQLKTPLSYEDEQLHIVLNAIADEYDIPIVFDKSALDEVAISPESEVSVNLRNISLRAALNIMLKEPGLEDLCYLIDEEVLLITTTEKANEALQTKVYRIDDFECFPYDEKYADEKPSQKTRLYYSPVPLIKAVVNCVEHGSWMANGTGEGAIFRMKPGMLVVTQTRRVHRQVEDFLSKLRVVKAEIKNDGSGSF